MQKSNKKRLFVVLLCLMSLMALCFSLVACGGTKYKVTVTDYNAEQGTVTVTPEAEGNEYKENAEVTVEAHGKGGYEVGTFTVSTDETATLDSEGKYTFKITADTTITVTFEPSVKVTDVALDQETLALEIGGLPAKAEATLQATVSPTNATNKNVSWASDEKDVATVDQTGKVTAVAEGTANITVTTEDGGKTKTCVVTVSQHQHAAVTGAEWQQDTENGKHYKLCECGARVEEATHAAAAGAEWQQDTENGKHYKLCVCGVRVEEASHSAAAGAEWQQDTENGKHYKLCECGVRVEEATHSAAAGATWQQDTETGKHYKLCECGVRVDEGTHSAAAGAEYTPDGTKHTYTCQVCSLTVSEDHEMSQEWSKNEEGHYHECTKCHSAERPVKHVTDSVTWTSKGTEEHSARCTECDYEVVEKHALGALTSVDADGHQQSCSKCDYNTEKEGHHLVFAYHSDLNHYQKCSDNCGYETETSNHDWSVDTDAQHHWAKCDICGFVYTQETMVGGHSLSEWKVDAQGRHYKECTATAVSGKVLDCPYETAHEAHDEASYQNDSAVHYKICPTCELRYDEDNHNFDSGTECTVCGYEKKECEHPADQVTYKSDNAGHHTAHCNACDTDVAELSGDCSYPLDEDGWYSGTGNCEHCGYQGLYEVTGTEISKYKGTFAKVKLPTAVLVADDAGGYTKSVSITGIAKGSSSASPFKDASITDVVIPANITSIGDYAFSGARITSISIPDTVTSLGKQAFFKCTSLLTATVGSGITGLAQSVFANCSTLQEVTLNIKAGAFSTGSLGNCAALTQVILKNVPTTISKNTFTKSEKAKLYFECSKAEYDSASPSILDTVVTQDKYYFYYAMQQEAEAARDSLAGFGGAWHYNDSHEVEEYPNIISVIGKGEVLLNQKFYEKGEKQC